jgi:hypothetical protein
MLKSFIQILFLLGAMKIGEDYILKVEALANLGPTA